MLHFLLFSSLYLFCVLCFFSAFIIFTSVYFSCSAFDLSELLYKYTNAVQFFTLLDFYQSYYMILNYMSVHVVYLQCVLKTLLQLSVRDFNGNCCSASPSCPSPSSSSFLYLNFFFPILYLLSVYICFSMYFLTALFPQCGPTTPCGLQRYCSHSSNKFSLKLLTSINGVSII